MTDPSPHLLKCRGSANSPTVNPDRDMDDLLDLIAREAAISRADLDLERPVDELGISSLDMINIVYAIEDRYKVAITPEEMQSVANVGELVMLARARMQGCDAQGGGPA